MGDFLGSGVLGSLLGGVFRLFPEVLKFFDRKNERMHELKMFEQQCQLEQLRGNQKLAEIGAEHASRVDSGLIDVFEEAVKQQAVMAKAAGGWVAALSASVRPVLTYYLLLLYGVVKTVYTVTGISAGMPPMDILRQVWTTDDVALLSGVINYWMLDRSLAKRGLA